MKRYHFRLAAVLRVRRAEEEAAKLELRAANVALREAVAARDLAAERYRALAAEGATTGSVADLHAQRLHAGLLAEQVAAAERLAMERTGTAVLAQARWSKAAKRVAVLERLDARRRAEHRAEEQRAEIALVDDLVTARYASEHAELDGADADALEPVR